MSVKIIISDGNDKRYKKKYKPKYKRGKYKKRKMKSAVFGFDKMMRQIKNE